jgi:hypothetical protein
LQNRHSKGAGIILSRIGPDKVYRNGEHEWKIPFGVVHALKKPLVHSQLANKYPWYVTWRSPKTGKRLKKYFNTLYQAIVFTAEQAQYVDKQATIVCRIGIEIPHALVGKLPRPWKWCPCCMKARKYKRVYPPETFSKIIRHPETWEEKLVEVPLFRCTVCGLTNRDFKYLRSNYWLVSRKIKKGVRKVKPLSEIQRQKKRERAARRRRRV